MKKLEYLNEKQQLQYKNAFNMVNNFKSMVSPNSADIRSNSIYQGIIDRNKETCKRLEVLNKNKGDKQKKLRALSASKALRDIGQNKKKEDAQKAKNVIHNKNMSSGKIKYIVRIILFLISFYSIRRFVPRKFSGYAQVATLATAGIGVAFSYREPRIIPKKKMLKQKKKTGIHTLQSLPKRNQKNLEKSHEVATLTQRRGI